jgi:uncharacterized membrane protein YeaQ/YmgE (transglycosylase-associated protein family)
MIFWLLIGLAAGAIAKWLTPQKEKGGWISSIVIGIIGSGVGGWVAGLIGARSWFGATWLGDLLIATGGAVLILFIYHKFLASKLKLPI